MWGTGEIISLDLDNNRIEISFSIGIKKLGFPAAFEQFIKAENDEVQAEIMKRIQQEKEAELIRKQEVESIKADSLKGLFGPDYHVEKLARQPILTYQQVENYFGISISGFGRGINSTKDAVVLISSINKSNGCFVYHDRWTENGDYIYSGEGKNGDQTMTKGNLAIKNALNNDKKIHLFVKFSPQEYYYQGVFELVDYTYEDECDSLGDIRKEYKFRLRKVSEQ